jgi:nickel-type superoxide dismutase maturation protease
VLWRIGVVLLGVIAVALRVRIVRVTGDSMLPTLGAGALLLTMTARNRTIRDGTLVTCRDPREPDRIIVKRVVARLDDLLDLRGDNPEASTDSRTFGLQRIDMITGVVVARLTRGVTVG